MSKTLRLLPLALLALVSATACDRNARPEPAAGIDLDAWEAWRVDRAEELSAEDGWLSLIGLSWLPPDEPTRFGTGNENQIVMPPRPSLTGAPATLGELTLTGGSVHLTGAPGAALQIDGSPIEPGKPTEVAVGGVGQDPSAITLGSVEMVLLERGDEIAFRARDRASERRELLDEFPIPTFPPDPGHVLGDITRFTNPRAS